MLQRFRSLFFHEPGAPGMRFSTVQEWRENVFYAIFVVTLILGAVALLVSAFYAVRHGDWLNLAVFCGVYVLALIFTFTARVPFRIRVTGWLAIFYLLGLVTFLSLGPVGSFRIWWFSLAVIAGLLLGLHEGIAAVVVNAASLTLLGYLAAVGHVSWSSDAFAPETWAITGVTFVFLNAVAVVSVALLIRGIEHLFVTATRHAEALRASHRRLETEVMERKKAEEEMERALELEKRFKADAAHFFLNPIAIAKGYMDLAMERMSQPGRRRLSAARAAIRRVESVIKNIVEKGEICE
jgi:signal transduction histidine kinase